MDKGVVGVSAAILRGDTVVYEKALGRASVDPEVPMAPETPLRLASVGKILTAVLALRLDADGSLPLDTSLAAVLPETAGWLSEEVTVAQALRHVTGLPDYVDVENERYLAEGTPFTDTVLLAHADGQPPLFDIESSWSYSNTGFYLVGMAQERATGQRWGALIREHIAAPLGLSTLTLCDDLLAEGRLHGYATGSAMPERSALYEQPGLKGDAGICASAADITRLARALDHGGLLPPAARIRLTQPTKIAGNVMVDYGLGTRLGRLGTYALWGHTGSFGNYNATLLRFPERDVTVAVLNNTIDAESDALEVASYLAEIALDLPAAELPLVPADPAGAERLAGTYVSYEESADPQYNDLVVTGAGLARRWSPEEELRPLTRLEPLVYVPPDWPRDRLVFKEVDGRVVGYAEYYSGVFSAYYSRVVDAP